MTIYLMNCLTSQVICSNTFLAAVHTPLEIDVSSRAQYRLLKNRQRIIDEEQV